MELGIQPLLPYLIVTELEMELPPLPSDEFDLQDDKGERSSLPPAYFATCMPPSPPSPPFPFPLILPHTTGHAKWAHLPRALCSLVLTALEDRDVVSAGLACRAWAVCSNHTPFGRAKRLFVDSAAAIQGMKTFIKLKIR